MIQHGKHARGIHNIVLFGIWKPNIQMYAYKKKKEQYQKIWINSIGIPDLASFNALFMYSNNVE